MKRPPIIETKEDRDSWVSILGSLSKKELVDLIVDRMGRDHGFSKEIYFKLVMNDSATEKAIKEYQEFVEAECEKRIPNVDVIVTMSEGMMASAEKKGDILETCWVYATVIEALDEALNQGAGMVGDNDYLLFELRDQCGEWLLETIQELPEEVFKARGKEISSFLYERATICEPVDDENQIMPAYNHLKSMLAST